MISPAGFSTILRGLAGLVLISACSDPQKVDGFPDTYAGIGLELEVTGDMVRVVRPIKGGPSEAAGIKADDEITAINGKSTEGMSLGEVVTVLRGRPGSQLTLSLRRQGSKLLVVLRRSRLKKTGKGYEAQEEEEPPPPPPKKKKKRKKRK